MEKCRDCGDVLGTGRFCTKCKEYYEATLWVEFKQENEHLHDGGASWFRKGAKVICIPGRE